MSSPSVTGSQSGSVAGVVIAKPTTRLRSRATRARCRASAGWVSASRQSWAKSSVRRSPAAGTSPAYDVAQARAWISAIASASSAQATRTETSAVGLLMAPFSQSASCYTQGATMHPSVTSAGSVGRVYGNDFGPDTPEVAVAHDPEAFTALLADEGRVEPRDDMPEA